MESFDITGELPTGTTLLEASAGTGKTFTVAALVTRYVAEGHATLDQLLVITFGRAASQELRERVRDQLVLAERALADPAGADRTHPVIDTLLRGDDADLALRRTRLRDALASFDAATIATTHQFCQIVLRSLGVAGDTDTGATLVDSLDELVVEVVDDVYLRRFGQLATAPPFGRRAGAGPHRGVRRPRDPRRGDRPCDGCRTRRRVRRWCARRVRPRGAGRGGAPQAAPRHPVVRRPARPPGRRPRR
jgi:exodeoxyribonuclease V beta subunit